MCNYIRNNTHTHTMVHFVMNFIYSSSMLRKYARRCKFVWLHWVGLSQISASAHFSVFHFVFRQTCNGYQLPLIRLLMDWCIVTISLKTVRIVYTESVFFVIAAATECTHVTHILVPLEWFFLFYTVFIHWLPCTQCYPTTTHSHRGNVYPDFKSGSCDSAESAPLQSAT